MSLSALSRNAHHLLLIYPYRCHFPRLHCHRKEYELSLSLHSRAFS